jgi:CRISPR-associated protein Csh1
MLRAMMTLALDFLFQELQGYESPPDDLEDWYQNLRVSSPGLLFSYLVEDTGRAEKVYVIWKPPEGDTPGIFLQDMTKDISQYLPFIKPSGSQGAQIGPVIKRSFDKRKNEAGPSRKILNTTMEQFSRVAQGKAPWSPYFHEILEILSFPRIRLQDGSIIRWSEKYDSMLECAIQEIGPAKGTVIITVKDSQGLLPGQRQEYLQYLFSEKLAGERYQTLKARRIDSGICPLCGSSGVALYPNALRGAGLNLKNVDREGAFPGLDLSQAWKGYALCLPCADLLYIYKYHVLKKIGPRKDVTPFTAPVAGEKALIIPFSTIDTQARQKLLQDVYTFIKQVPDDVEFEEANLLDVLQEHRGLLNLTFLWAKIGQYLEDVDGVLTDVPPSRLRQLSRFNAETKTWRHPLFPEYFIEHGKFTLRPDLSLKALRPLFDRPGRKLQTGNTGRRLSIFTRNLAAIVYHQGQIPLPRFWEEAIITARYYWTHALTGKDAYKWLLSEDRGKRGPFLTAAGWIRHLAWWLYYFKRLEVMPMETNFFEPELETLKPYFGPESGINSPEKAYAFLLGVLYGKLLAVQGKLEINVRANALTWLKRLTLDGRDLPELYTKIREKLLIYGTEKSQKVRDLVTEIGKVGVKLGDPINLSQTQTGYYLLLGQSLATTILKKDSEDAEKA